MLGDGRVLVVGGWRFGDASGPDGELEIEGEATGASWVYDANTGVISAAGVHTAVRGVALQS